MLFFTAPLLFFAPVQMTQFSRRRARARPLVYIRSLYYYVKILARFSPFSPFFALTVHLLPPEAFLCLPTREDVIQVSFSVFTVPRPAASAPQSHFKTSFHRVIKAALSLAPQHTYTHILSLLIWSIVFFLFNFIGYYI